MAFVDTSVMSDAVSVGLDTTVTAPEHPCVKCGKTTRRHHDKLDDAGAIIGRTRICSNKVCRTVVDET